MRPALLWFRNDLRLADNPALACAAEEGRAVAALYVLDDASEGVRPMGAASRWWLAQSLRALAADLKAHGIPLILEAGPAQDIVPALAHQLDAERVAFNFRAGAAEAAVDCAVADALAEQGREARRFNGSLLYKPGSVLGANGALPRTFSAFHRAALRSGPPRQPIRRPAHLKGVSDAPPGRALEELGLEPTAPDWAGGMRAAWTCGEAGARARLESFIAHGLKGYARYRDVPARDNVSRLSPHLAAGEISPNQVLSAVRHAAEAGEVPQADAAKFEAELHWREFSYHLLDANPDMARRNLQSRFDDFSWHTDAHTLKAWQTGRTGYPLIDAGLRQLWQTGWMHNRVRMVVASFLTKHLLIDWRIGEDWFWDTLVDADPANNAASWQWVAGTGMDAAPYFRVFNPILQGEKFDPDGEYVRTFVPELARLPDAVLHKPWTASPDILAKAGVTLGKTYPAPIVDHDTARARALRAYDGIKGK